VNVAGTSAGAIVAALLVVGYRADEIRAVLKQTDYRRFADFGPGGKLIGGPLNALRRRGFAPGAYFREWLADRFEEKLGKRDPTFADVVRTDLPPDLTEEQREKARYRLRVIASNVTCGQMIVLPDDVESYANADGKPFEKDSFPLVDAVRMSMSYPFLFDPVTLYRDGKPHYVVDGGLLSNFPIWLYDSPNPKRPTWGFRLHGGVGPEELPYRKIGRPFWELALANAMFHAAMEAWDRKHLERMTAARTVSIPTHAIKTTQFGLSAQEADDLYRWGYEEAKAFFRSAEQREYMNSFGQAPETAAPAPAPAG
jgi:NTE family protein